MTVVGAGVGGLAAAARLAAAGHTVTVCEQAGEIGGKLGVLERDGFRFDTGPSLLTVPHVLGETFAATGARLDEVLDLEPVEPIARYRFADGARVDVSADLPATVASLEGGLSPGSGTEWQQLLRRGERIWRAVEEPFLRRPVSVRALARRLRDLPTVAPGKTLRHLGVRYLHDPRLRMLLDRYATYAGSDPRRAPAALATIPYVEQAFGAWYVRGGLGSIAGALADRAAERGARILTDCEVVAVERAGGRAAGVRLASGQRLPADVVVAGVDAAHLYGDLLHGPAAGVALGRLRRAVPSLSGFVLLLGVRGRTPGSAHHNVLFPADYDAEFDALFGPDPRPVPDPTLYVVVPRDPTVAPAGHEAWFVLANAPLHGHGRPGGVAPGGVSSRRRSQAGGGATDPSQRAGVGARGRRGSTGEVGSVDWGATALVDAYRQRILDVLEARGMGVRDRLVFAEARTPLDLEVRTRAVGGAIYGTSSNGVRAAFLRPANRSPIPGLFLVGGSAHPGGGLPLVLLSAAIVADLIGPT